MRRSAFSLLTLLGLTPVLMADDCDYTCCEKNGSFIWISEEECDDMSGSPSSHDEESCATANTDDTDDTEDPGGATCEDFCSASEAACPSDTACQHSCENAPNALTAADVACMQAATDCASANDCWGTLYPS